MLGLVLSYIRLYHGIKWDIVFHSAYNNVLIISVIYFYYIGFKNVKKCRLNLHFFIMKNFISSPFRRRLLLYPRLGVFKSH